MEFHHVPVLFNETVDSLCVTPGGTYVDCTGGSGGHSAAVLEKLSGKGKLIIFDRDPDAIANLKEKFASYNNVIIINDNFSNIRNVLDGLGIEAVDGIMADLGISSYQVDTAERGFSYHKDAKLDMRMSKQGLSAEDVVNTYSERELFRVISCYGEERFAGNIARAIVKARENKRIETTFELSDIISSAIPAKFRRDGHPARKTFQAIRIEVNGELEMLPDAVEAMFRSLKPGGLLSIISFHSLEDRILKQKYREFCQGCVCPKDYPVCVCGRTPEGELPFRSKSPSEEELEANPRSRSARLRCIKRL